MFNLIWILLQESLIHFVKQVQAKKLNASASYRMEGSQFWFRMLVRIYKKKLVNALILGLRILLD